MKDNKVVINIGRSYPAEESFLAFNKQSGKEAANCWAEPNLHNNAFTLIELLVVVLIIGILAAVAVPQYKRAVEKSKATQAITLLKTVFESAEAYYLTNGTWPSSFEQLDVDIPWMGNTPYATWDVIRDSLSNEDWSIQLYKQRDSSGDWGVLVGRLSGPYRGGGFSMFYQYPTTSSIRTRRLLCNEQYRSDSGAVFDGKENAYCSKLFRASRIYTGSYLRYYLMP